MKKSIFAAAGLAVILVLAMAGMAYATLSGLSDSEVEAKVKDLVSKMTLDEKIAQMHGSANPVNIVRGGFMSGIWDTAENKRLGIPALKCIDGPRGVGMKGATAFPVGMSRGASFDPELEKRIGEAMGYETRAMGANILLAPCINILRHPSWGRAQESYGEDPLVLGKLGAAFVVGTQKHVMACSKHYAANNIEGSRFYVNAVLDERTLREVYLPHFKMTVDAGVASVMSAYNDVNGFLAGQNKHIITDILKNEMGFKGFVISDWQNATDNTLLAANAGMDIEMPTGAHLGGPLKKAVENGEVSQAVIDDAVTRILREKLSFITPDFQKGYDKSKVGGKDHAALAREAAQEGTVLLKNANNALPLDPKAVKTVTVIGKLADSRNLGDKGSSDVPALYAITPLQGIKNKVGSLAQVIYNNGADLESAKAAAKAADAVIMVVGMTAADEGEGGYGLGDRLNLNLHADEEKLIKAIAPETGRLIVVMEAGAAVLVENWMNDAEAIVMAWYPGMEGGNALADLLFGEVNFSGKLPITFGKTLDQYPPFDIKAKEVKMEYFLGYRWFDHNGAEPRYPFGYGLSYTTYKYANLKLDKKQIGKSGAVIASVDVTNTGNMAGAEIVQLYIGYTGSKVERAKKDLRGFTRVALKPGETRTVSLPVKAADLAYYDVGTKSWVVEEIEYSVMVGPSSSAKDLGLKGSFKVSGM